MNNNAAVIEYLLNQLRQQLTNNAVDVMEEVKRWSIDRSIAARGNYTDEENAIIDAYIGLQHNPYKQQCEDLAHEVQSLKNQLRDAQEQIKELHRALVKATGDAEAYKLIRKGGYIPEGRSYVAGEHGPEQSGCRKDDTQGCKHDWFRHLDKDYCFKCGVTKSEECDHNWIIAPGLFIAEGHKDNVPGSRFCCECGAREWDDDGHKPKADTQKCKHEWEYYYPNGEEYRRCAKCGVISE